MEWFKDLAKSRYESYFGELTLENEEKYRRVLAKSIRKACTIKPFVIYDSAMKCKGVEEINARLKLYRKQPLQESAMYENLERTLDRICQNIERELKNELR